MQPVKQYNPLGSITITLSWEQWDTVLHWLQYGADYHDAKKHEWLCNCVDKRMAGQKASEHDKAAAEAAALHKLIEQTIFPPQTPKTE